MYSEECRSGNHPLIEIYEVCHDHLSETVVRWCPQCGAITVDIDYDGRTNPGDVVPMMFPEITKAAHKGGEK